MSPLKRNERVLFSTLWLFIVLGSGLWMFWPDRESARYKQPTVELSEELKRFFSTTTVGEGPNGSVQIQLGVHPDYQQTMSGTTQSLVLGFQLQRERVTLAANTVPVTILGNSAPVTLEIPASGLRPFSVVRLYLAR